MNEIAEYFGRGEEPKFAMWGEEINRLCENEIGMSIMDLPDQNFRDMFEDGMTAAQAWEEIKDSEGFNL